MHPRYNDAYKKGVGARQVADFLKQGFSVILNSPSLEKPIVLPKQGKNADEVWLEFHNKVKENNGSSIIHN